MPMTGVRVLLGYLLRRPGAGHGTGAVTRVLVESADCVVVTAAVRRRRWWNFGHGPRGVPIT